MDPESGAAHRHNHYKEYLRWFHSIARVSVKPPRSNEPIEDRADTDDDDDIVAREFSRRGALCRITW